MEKVMILLVVCSAMTTLITEGIKRLMPEDKEYSKNVLAAIVSVVVGIGVGSGYLILNQISFTAATAVYGITLIVLSWLTATVGYDKVVQTVKQIRSDEQKAEI